MIGYGSGPQLAKPEVALTVICESDFITHFCNKYRPYARRNRVSRYHGKGSRYKPVAYRHFGQLIVVREEGKVVRKYSAV